MGKRVLLQCPFSLLFLVIFTYPQVIMDNKELKHQTEHECYGENTEYISEMNAMYQQWKEEQEMRELQEIMEQDTFETPLVEENKPKKHEQEIIL